MKKNRSNLCVLFFTLFFIFSYSFALDNNEHDGDHLHYETIDCIFDVRYPDTSNEFTGKVVRKFIDDSVKNFERPDLEDSSKKNEFWVDGEDFVNGKIESVLLEYYEYAQGAHGASYVRPLYFDLNDNGVLKSDDFFKDKNWKRELMPVLNKIISDSDRAIFLDDEDKINSFVVSDKGFIFYFDQCEVAACSEGVVKIMVPFEKIKPFLSSYTFGKVKK